MTLLRLPLRKRLALDLFARYRKAQAALHDLKYLFWECTLRCNLNCLHCGSDCRSEAQVRDMPLPDFLNVLDEVAEQYAPKNIVIALTGGEPLLREDLEDCGRAFHERGFAWGMVSNGYVLNQQRLEGLLASGLRSLTISLDGLEESHNWLRGRADSFDRASAAIQMSAAVPSMAFDVVTCVNGRNFDELRDLAALLTSWGVRKWRLFTIFPKGRAEHTPLLDVNHDQFAGLMEFIREEREDGALSASYGCEGFLGPYEADVRRGFFWCRAGIHIGSVLADGSISACPSLRGDYVQGNIYEDSFLDCWNHRFKKMRDRGWTKTGVCETCSAYKWCEGNGLHLRDEKTGALLRCHLRMLGS